MTGKGEPGEMPLDPKSLSKADREALLRRLEQRIGQPKPLPEDLKKNLEKGEDNSQDPGAGLSDEELFGTGD
jgi:hypothetical protein